MKRPAANTTNDGIDGTPTVERTGLDAQTSSGRRELAGRLAGLSLPRQVFVLSIWPLMEQVLNFLVTFVDTMRAGHLSVEATNAIGTGAYVLWVISIVQGAVGIGSAAIIARAIGARHRGLANAALGQSLTLAAISGLLIGGLLYLLAPGMSRLVGLSGTSLELSILYLRAISLAAPMSAVLFVGSASLRAAGDMVSPFVVMLVVNVVNYAASGIFIYARPPWGGHGVAGIAAATVLAWSLGAVLMVGALSTGWAGLRLHWRRLLLQGHTVKRILRVTLPNAAESIGTWTGQIMTFWVVGQIGMKGLPAAIGAHTIAVRVEAISYLPGTAMGYAAATLAGQYLGLGDPDRARRAVRLCWITGMVIMGAMGVMFFLIPNQLVAIVTDKPELLALAPPLLRIAGPIEIFLGTYLVLSQALRGAGDTRAAMIMSYLSIFCVRVPAAYLLGLTFGWKLTGLWFGICGELVFRGSLFALRFRHDGWMKAKV